MVCGEKQKFDDLLIFNQDSFTFNHFVSNDSCGSVVFNPGNVAR